MATTRVLLEELFIRAPKMDDLETILDLVNICEMAEFGSVP